MLLMLTLRSADSHWFSSFTHCGDSVSQRSAFFLPRRKPFPEPPPQPSQALYLKHIKLEQPGKREVKRGAAAIRLTPN